MATVCLTCGYKGRKELLINCPECHDSPQHLYCLEVSPYTYFKKHFTWICEDCKPKSVQHSTSGVRPTRHHHKENSKEKKVKNKSNRKEGTGCAAKIKVQTFEGSGSYDKGQKLGQILDDQDSSADEIRYVKTTEISSCDPPKATEDFDYVAEPTWRGTLRMMNRDFTIISGVQAHLSCLAGAKVHDKAKLLPKLLFPDLVSRRDVWPKKFVEVGPSDQNIALYFFPDHISTENDFDDLVVRMVQEDQAMIAVLDHTELLVFTSTVLPEQFQRFQGKLYLWGVLM